jgi:hypothetical protein
MSILLDGSPAFLILEISTCIPELQMNFAEVCNTWGWISLEVNNSIIFRLNQLIEFESYLHPAVGL